MQTESIDRLFLELSQVTKAKTARELALEAENKTLRESLSAIRMAAGKGEDRQKYRPAVLRVMTCKNGKPPEFQPDHTPELLRYIADDEATNVEGRPWFVIAFVPESVFGPGDSKQ